jgi:endonuclease YncB( thermonuclease family)
VIIKGRERGGAVRWARHLTNERDNDHVRIVELRGVVSQSLRGAFEEIQAHGAGSRARKPFFSVEICPEAHEPVTADVLAEVMERIERAFPKLKDRARVLVEHEKEGRIHWHVTWSRIGDNGKAINLPFTGLRCAEISAAMHMKLGTMAPEGLADIVNGRKRRKGATLAECRQTERVGLDIETVREQVSRLWNYCAPDAEQTIEHLAQAGFFLARGDKRGFVLVHTSGEVFSLTRVAGITAKDAKARLGDPAKLKDVTKARALMKAMAEEAERLTTVRIAEHIERTRTTLFDRMTETAFGETLANMRSEQRTARIAAADLPETEQAALRARQRSDLVPISGLVALLKKARAQREQALAAMKAIAMLRPAWWQDAYGRILSTAFWLVGRPPLTAKNRKPPAPELTAAKKNAAHSKIRQMPSLLRPPRLTR